jgi:hypothetical protein
MILALAAATIIASCPWQDRGLDRFMGDIPAAVDTYTDIPKYTRLKLQAKMRRLAYDDITHMTATGSRSESWTYGLPTMMHFGAHGRVCRTVDISTWTPQDPGERGLVYCEDGHCVVVWTVCRNVSQIKRIGPVTPPKSPPPHSVVIPPIESPGGLDVPLPERSRTLAFVNPPPVTFQPLDLTAEFEFVEPTETSERITADQGWFEWRQWMPLFGPVPQRSFVPVGEQLLPQPVFPPVPGIMPPIAVLPPLPGLPSSTPADPKLPGGAVSVTPIPEPGTYVLMLVGLFGVALMVRKRASHDQD